MLRLIVIQDLTIYQNLFYHLPYLTCVSSKEVSIRSFFLFFIDSLLLLLLLLLFIYLYLLFFPRSFIPTFSYRIDRVFSRFSLLARLFFIIQNFHQT